jgi:transcriptional regulator with XRE-family HTH domain
MTPDTILVQNIRALLDARRRTDRALATYCGHRPPWLSKILKGERGVSLRDLGHIATFFGISVSDLFRPDVALEMERRRWDRRESGRRASDMEQSLIAAPIPNA